MKFKNRVHTNRTIRDGIGRGGTARDGTARDGTRRDGTRRGGTARDGTGRDMTGLGPRFFAHAPTHITKCYESLVKTSNSTDLLVKHIVF